MPARLVPLTPGSAPVVTLQRPVVLVGRHPECDVRIDLPQVSRRHCCIALAYDRLLVKDLGSRNGLRVNGRRVEEAQLRPGDEVAIAHVIYRLEEFATAPPPPARPVPQPARSSDLPVAAGKSADELIPLDDDLVLDD
jgi:pSer/pThr/pTyr-binding forkhead associated (FHA) protein